MAYLERLQNGLLGAAQSINNPSNYLAARQQAQAQQAQNVANQYAQATQQGKASMAQLQNQEQQMMAAGEQAIKQKEAEEAKQRQQMMQIGLAVATGGLGGSGAAEGAAGAAEGAGAAAGATGAATGLLGDLSSASVGSTAAAALPEITEGASVLGNAGTALSSGLGADAASIAATSGLLGNNIQNLGKDEDSIKNEQAGPNSWANLLKAFTGLPLY